MERPTLFVLFASGEGAALMPALERQKWHDAMPDIETFYWGDAEGPQSAFTALAAKIGGSSLGVEGLRMRAAEYRALAALLGAEAVSDADPVLVQLRLLKDADEIADLRRAFEIAQAAFGETLDAGLTGHSETAIAARLKSAILAHGASGFSFEPIMLGGPASANLHGDASDRQITPAICR